MTFTTLASSSAGNAYIVAGGGGRRILLECGLPWPKLQRLAGFALSRLDACLISHEHSDHSRTWAQLVKNGVTVCATQGTAEALGMLAPAGPQQSRSGCASPFPSGVPAPLLHLFDGEEAAPGKYVYDPVTLGGFDVLPFQTFHDAAEPVGFLIRCRRDGEQLLFATDTVSLAYRFPPVEIAAIECNYSPALLAGARRLPEKVKDRITKTHLSVGRTCAVLAGLDRHRLREVYLLHLSAANVSAADCAAAARRAVGPGIRVIAAPAERKTQKAVQ